MKPYDSSLVSHLFLAKRENNPNRAHIIVNTRQAKHFPSDPVKSLENFETLARKAAQDGRAEKPTVVIAFAETATAIGAVVAGAFHDCFFVTTTREKLPDWATAITFEESHSHAKQHYLCVRDEDIFRRAAQVVLVDDEYTTGSTALSSPASARSLSSRGSTLGLGKLSITSACLLAMALNSHPEVGSTWDLPRPRMHSQWRSLYHWAFSTTRRSRFALPSL